MPLQEIIAAGAELVDDKTAAALIQVSPGTLSVWRSTGRYQLPFIKVGAKVRYKRGDLQAWLDSRYRSTGATA
jgi:predicted site-specific integrase-resolvase